MNARGGKGRVVGNKTRVGAQNVTYGQNRPLEERGPSRKERLSDEHLAKVMNLLDPPEKNETMKHREFVLNELHDICQNWAKQVSRDQHLPDSTVAETVVKLCTYGSYRLGVHSAGADIDLLCIGPRHISHDNFFGLLKDMLMENTKVKELTDVPNAYVPLMKFSFDGVDIDMVYAQVQVQFIDNTFDIFDDNRVLKNCDNASVRSLNGVRVTDSILNLVPNQEMFKQTLCVIRLWARHRAIYSNVQGYLGGVSWGILVARLCQLYPNANAAALVTKFFRFYNIWQFGFEYPIKLTDVPDNDELPEFQQWNPQQDPRQKNDKMPIITPAFPTMNSTYRVSASTFRILKDEFARGLDITSPNDQNKIVTEDMWEYLFEKKPFFDIHKHFLIVRVQTWNKEYRVAWEGFVAAKLRNFVMSLENHEVGLAIIPYPYFSKNDRQPSYTPKSQEEDDERPPCETVHFIALEFNMEHRRSKSFDFSSPVAIFTNAIHNSPIATESENACKAKIEYCKRARLRKECPFLNLPKRRKKKKSVELLMNDSGESKADPSTSKTVGLGVDSTRTSSTPPAVAKPDSPTVDSEQDADLDLISHTNSAALTLETMKDGVKRIISIDSDESQTSSPSKHKERKTPPQQFSRSGKISPSRKRSGPAIPRGMLMLKKRKVSKVEEPQEPQRPVEPHTSIPLSTPSSRAIPSIPPLSARLVSKLASGLVHTKQHVDLTIDDTPPAPPPSNTAFEAESPFMDDDDNKDPVLDSRFVDDGVESGGFTGVQLFTTRDRTDNLSKQQTKKRRQLKIRLKE